MKFFYFSGTGNSLYIAKRFEDDIYSIPQVLKRENSPYIFVIMTFGNNNGDSTKYVTSFAKKHNIKD